MKISPEIKPKQIWETYGFPLVSKEVAKKIEQIRRNPDCNTSRKFLTKEQSMHRVPLMWRYLIDEPYDTSAKCCDYLKKKPVHKIAKEMGLAPIIGIMADESKLRRETYIKRGQCNVFAKNIEKCSSMPLAIWTEKDIWDYIKKYNIQIPDIYSKGVRSTGCAACAFGAAYPDDKRFKALHDLYPKYYNMVMGWTNNGVTYRDALNRMYLEAFGGHKTLPDENIPL